MPKTSKRNLMLGEIICVTKSKRKAYNAERTLKKSGYHSVITEYIGGKYLVKGIEKSKCT